VKVLSRSAATAGQVSRHADYVSRNGEVELETDDGLRLREPDAGVNLIRESMRMRPRVRSVARTIRTARRASTAPPRGVSRRSYGNDSSSLRASRSTSA
jgi:hypothetical protein